MSSEFRNLIMETVCTLYVYEGFCLQGCAQKKSECLGWTYQRLICAALFHPFGGKKGLISGENSAKFPLFHEHFQKLNTKLLLEGGKVKVLKHI
jgi:hypothetical protein